MCCRRVAGPCPATLRCLPAFRAGHGTKILHRGLDGRFTTLAQHLAANGYQTVGLASNAILSTTLGFDRGFQTYWTFPADKDAFSDVSNSDSIATVMHAQLAKWLTEKYDANEPFFLFLNYVEAHQPYRPPRDMLKYASTESWDRWQGRNQPVLSFDYMLTGTDLLSSKDIAELESLYDDEIRQLDRKVGELLEYFKSTGLDENTLVIITADHGEHFGERHRMSHQFSLYEPLVRVPLVVRYADRFQGGEEERLVQSHDIFPTVLQLAGLEWKPKPGQTCQSLLEPASEKRTGISEYLMFDAGDSGTSQRVSPASRPVAFRPTAAGDSTRQPEVDPAGAGKPELYDLTSDPTETRDLADQQPDVTRDLSDKLAAWSRSFEHYAASPVPRDLKESAPSEAEIKAMRGLGYLQ